MTKTEVNEQEKQQRKQRAKNGTRSQKMVNFRADEDVVKFLETCLNKGRAINEAIREYKRARNKPEHDDGVEAQQIENYMP